MRRHVIFNKVKNMPQDLCSCHIPKEGMTGKSPSKPSYGMAMAGCICVSITLQHSQLNKKMTGDSRIRSHNYFNGNGSCMEGDIVLISPHPLRVKLAMPGRDPV